MADTEYFAVYKQFFLEFAGTVNPDDQLPVKVAGYCICDNELHGEIVDWILQYLSQKRCPSTLIAPLAKIVLAEITEAIKTQPEDCGYRKDDNAYQPLKLMQTVTAKVNDVCLRYLEPARLSTLPPPVPELATSVCSIKNTRRRMEDRHTVIDDFHTVFGVKDAGLASYYGVFDGHAGTDAAVYGVSHLHQFLAESPFYPREPERALKDAFLRTDTMFLEKCERDNLRSGTTALCALLLHERRMLYVGWLGDSQAVLVRRGVPTQLVDPHKPGRPDERQRIEAEGGCVLFWGIWRVNGQLAVSRAIGDYEYKPHVSASADVIAIPIEDNHDFVILACDGLWDFVSEQQATVCVYETIREHPGDLEAVSASLVRLSKLQGSVDNISVIVVFLTPPDKLASLDVWPSPDPTPDPAMDPTTLENGCLTPLTPEMRPNGTHGQTNGGDLAYQKANFQLELENGKCQPMSHTDVDFLDRPPADGKEDTFDEDDFGPETDVDALDGGADVDDVLMSPTIAAEKAAAAAVAVGNPKEQHLAAIEADLELQRQQLSVFDPVSEPREETPTPPADDVIGEAAVEPETDNVAESGDESEDEWNYYRVDPSEKKPTEAAAEIHAEPTRAEQPADEDEESMESRLNPNAAEFVPSPTSMMPNLEEVLSGSPFKGKITPMDNVFVPSASEFQREFHKRPSDLHEFAQSFVPQNAPSFAPDFGQNVLDFGQNDPQAVPDYGQTSPLAAPDFGQSSPLDLPDFAQTGAFQADDFANGDGNCEGSYGAREPEFAAPTLAFKPADYLFDKSEVSSTLAEFGDETSTSFATDDMDQRAYGDADADLDASMTQSDFLAAELHNTLDLSTEMTSAEGDARNDSNPFLEPQDASPAPSPTKVCEAASSVEPLSPNAESGIGTEDSPLQPCGPDDLGLDPAMSRDSAPTQDHYVSSGNDFEDFKDFESPPCHLDVFESPEPAFQATEPAFQALEPAFQAVEPAFQAVEPAFQAAEPEVSVEEAVVPITEPESIASFEDFELIPRQPDVCPVEPKAPETPAAEPLSHADLEDFLNAPPAALTNGFGSQEHAAQPDIIAETVAAEVEAKPEEPKTSAVAVPVAAAAAVAAVATVAAATTKGAKKPAAVTAKASPRAAATKTATSPSKTAAPRLPATPTAKRTPVAASPTTRVAPRVSAASSKPVPKAAAPAPKTTTLAARPKPAAAPLAKPAPATKTTTVPPRPRVPLVPKAAVGDKKPLANGDVKPIAKRPEPLAVRKTVPAVSSAPAKPAARPLTAPARAARPATTTTTTATRTTLAARTTTAASAAKPATNGVSKPRPATTLGVARAKPSPGAVDKQVKETANKQISQTVGKSTTVTRTTTTTTRRVVGAATKTGAATTTTTTTTKSTGPIRRPPGTTGAKSTATTTVKTSEVPLIEPELAEITSTITSVVKDDSPVIDDNNAAVVIGTD